MTGGDRFVGALDICLTMGPATEKDLPPKSSIWNPFNHFPTSFSFHYGLMLVKLPS